MKQIIIHLAFVFGLLLSIAGHLAVHFATNGTEQEQIDATNIYMQSNAIVTFVFVLIIAALTSGVFSKVCYVISFLAFGKVLDELFFDPTAYHWNDLLTFNIAIVIITVIITRHLTTKK